MPRGGAGGGAQVGVGKQVGACARRAGWLVQVMRMRVHMRVRSIHPVCANRSRSWVAGSHDNPLR